MNSYLTFIFEKYRIEQDILYLFDCSTTVNINVCGVCVINWPVTCRTSLLTNL